MTTEVASLYAYIRGDTTGLTRSLQTAQQQISGFGRNLTSALGLGALTGGFAALGTVIGQGITSTVNNAVNQLKALSREALGVVASYEGMAISARQLMATQILQAGVTQSMAEALELAQGPAQDLLKWQQQLAIESPFQMQDVAATFNMALAMGFSASEAKRATQAFTDWSSAAGISGQNLRLVMLNMGQVAAMGKITGREIRDFAMHGLPAMRILADAFGVTTAEMQDMVSDGVVPAGQAIEALVGYMEQNYAGAAKNMATSWSGLTSSLADVRQQSLRLLSTGIATEIQPFAIKLIDALTDQSNMTKIEAAGKAIGWQFKAGLDMVVPLIRDLWGAGMKEQLQAIMQGVFGPETLNGAGLFVSLLGSVARGMVTAVSEALKLGMTIDLLKVVFVGVGQVAEQVVIYIAGLMQMLGNAITASMDAIHNSVWMSSAIPGTAEWRQYKQGAEEANAQLELVLSNMGDFSRASSGYIADAAGKAGTAMSEAYTKYNEQIAASNELTKAQLALIDEATKAGLRMSVSMPKPQTGYGGRLGSEDAEGLMTAGQQSKQEAAAAAALAQTQAMGGGSDGILDGLKSSKAKAAVDEFANFVKGALSGAVQDSLALGKVGAGGDLMKPGAGGPFEALFRIQDIAINAGKPGKDTKKWMEMYGLDQDQAKGIVEKFQMGIFDKDVSQYVDKEKLKEVWNMKQLAEDSQAALMEELGLAAKGQGGEAFKALTGMSGTAKENAAAAQPAVDAMIGAYDASLTSGADAIKNLGGKLYDNIEEGFVNRAKDSKAFQKMVEIMIDGYLLSEL